ncbi:MAG TPA: phosphodiester glycosidase family protein [Acidimicrobiales bacterium]|nr:phosphodiester glycosidase family protein [Acidimicrobiales bacterium]
MFSTTVRQQILVASMTVAIVLGQTAPAAEAEPTVEVSHATLAPGLEHYTMHDPEGPNVINVVVIEPYAEVELKTVMVDAGGRAQKEPASELCRRAQCLVAINGDFFDRGGQPLGALVTDGHVLVAMPGLPVPAHWQLTLDIANRLFIDVDLRPEAYQSTGASYPLVVDGQPQVIDEPTPFAQGPGPRSFIGWNPTGQKFIVTVDGRSPHSRGVTLAEGAAMMLELGAVNAINLDGGGSTTLVINGNVVNTPSDGAERLLTNAWVVVPKATAPPAPAAPTIAAAPEPPDVASGPVTPAPAARADPVEAPATTTDPAPAAVPEPAPAVARPEPAAVVPDVAMFDEDRFNVPEVILASSPSAGQPRPLAGFAMVLAAIVLAGHAVHWRVNRGTARLLTVWR